MRVCARVCARAQPACPLSAVGKTWVLSGKPGSHRENLCPVGKTWVLSGKPGTVGKTWVLSGKPGPVGKTWSHRENPGSVGKTWVPSGKPGPRRENLGPVGKTWVPSGKPGSCRKNLVPSGSLYHAGIPQLCRTSRPAEEFFSPSWTASFLCICKVSTHSASTQRRLVWCRVDCAGPGGTP